MARALDVLVVEGHSPAPPAGTHWCWERWFSGGYVDDCLIKWHRAQAPANSSGIHVANHPEAQLPMCVLWEVAHFVESGPGDPSTSDLLNQEHGLFSASSLCWCGRQRTLWSREYGRLGRGETQQDPPWTQMLEIPFHWAHMVVCFCKIFSEDRDSDYSSGLRTLPLSTELAFTLTWRGAGIARGILGISLRGSWVGDTLCLGLVRLFVWSTVTSIHTCVW